jgi:hypothetical protein
MPGSPDHLNQPIVYDVSSGTGRGRFSPAEAVIQLRLQRIVSSGKTGAVDQLVILLQGIRDGFNIMGCNHC